MALVGIVILVLLAAVVAVENGCSLGSIDYAGLALLQGQRILHSQAVEVDRRDELSEIAEQVSERDSVLDVRNLAVPQCPQKQRNRVQNARIDFGAHDEADLRCSPQQREAPARPVIIFVGSPPGKMTNWMNQLTGEDVVGINLKTWHAMDIERAVTFFQTVANAQRYGVNPKRVILAGYSRGGINSHSALSNMMRKGRSPWGCIWFNGVTRGKPWKEMQRVNPKQAPRILIIQGLLDNGFLAASVKYRAALDALNLPYTFLPIPKAHHSNLRIGAAVIRKEVARFLQVGDASRKCVDKRSPYMIKKDLACEKWPYGVQQCNACKRDHLWVKAKYCQRSCFLAGCGYDGDVCI
jgi:predicted esterase